MFDFKKFLVEVDQEDAINEYVNFIKEGIEELNIPVKRYSIKTVKDEKFGRILKDVTFTSPVNGSNIYTTNKIGNAEYAVFLQVCFTGRLNLRIIKSGNNYKLAVFNNEDKFYAWATTA